VKHFLTVLLSLALSAVSGDCFFAHAAESPAPREQEAATSDQPAHAQPSLLCAGSPLSSHTEIAAAQHTEEGEKSPPAQGAAPSDFPLASPQRHHRRTENTATLGEGDGCFYQRASSPLPLFKDGGSPRPDAHGRGEPDRQPLNNSLTFPRAPAR
jgi:hypothetical protein